MPSEKLKSEKGDHKDETPEIYKQLNEKTESYKQAKLVLEKIYSWSIKTLIKIDKAQKIMGHNYYEKYPKERGPEVVSQAFMKVLETLKTTLASVKDQDTEKVLAEIDKTRLDEEMKKEDFLHKNIRVRPTANRVEKRTSDSLSNSKASFSKDDFDFDETEGEDGISTMLT
jgi:hypothetical protein